MASKPQTKFEMDPRTGLLLPSYPEPVRAISGNRHFSAVLETALPYKDRQTKHDPSSLSRYFEECEYWADENPFVGMVLAIREAFCGYGFRLAIRSEGEGKFLNPDSPDVKPEISKWWKDYQSAVRLFHRVLWRDWLRYQNVVVLWRGDPAYQPTLLPLQGERTTLDESGGILKVKYLHNLTGEQIRALVSAGHMSEEAGSYYAQHSRVVLSEDRGEYHEVFRVAAPGQGFGIPRMKSIFRACDVMESISAGDSILGEEARILQKLYKLGHAIQSGPHAGSPAHFYKKSRAQGVMNDWGKTPGRKEGAVNFDHEVEHSYIDPKYFDSGKYAGSLHWINAWSTPIVQMLEAKQGQAISLLPILRAQCLMDRDILKSGLERIISEQWKPPGTVRVEWGTQCFVDDRLLSTFVRAGRNDGTLSDQTTREFFGFDHGLENSRKSAEAQEPSSMHVPLYDGNHGGGDSGGRPSGKGDSASRSGRGAADNP